MAERLRYLSYPPTSLPIRDLFILENVPFAKGYDVLEIGAGSGETAARLSLDCRTVTAIDISKPMIDKLLYLKERYQNLFFKVIDITKDVSLDSRYHIIISFDTLEHVAKPDKFFRFISSSSDLFNISSASLR